MNNAHCPACGAVINFRSSVSVYAVCAYCQSMVVRHDVELEAIGTMAELPDDMSPLQIGSEGVYNNVPFLILGRAKMAWDDGTWNEWFFWINDGRKGWLAEAQGFFAASFEIDQPWDEETQRALRNLLVAYNIGVEGETKTRSPADKPGLGRHLKLRGVFYRIVDIKKAVCVGSEGELPFSAPRGRSVTSLDLIGPGGEFGCVEIEGQKARLFLGHYREWDEFHLRNLRELEGWS